MQTVWQIPNIWIRIGIQLVRFYSICRVVHLTLRFRSGSEEKSYDPDLAKLKPILLS